VTAPAATKPGPLTGGYAQYGPGAIATPGSSTAGPGEATTQAAVGAWYRPAHKLGQRSVAVFANEAALASSANPARKYVQLRNLSSTDPVFYGDSEQVTVGPIGDPRAGMILYPGEGTTLDQREYDGDVWVITAAGAATVDVRVVDPTTDQ
jgi:hypothetical protein